MTNPTSNFGWQMPTSTDLVTDLPADFEVFGQAVDTSLADLKGGTTGQILTKASNANMDFTWSSETGDISAVTAGTGLSGGGTSGAVTLSIDTAVTVDVSTAQTLTNKTLTAPIVNLALNAQTGTTYTFVLADNGKLVTASNSSAQTYTIPLNSSVAFPIGAQINLIQIGSGQVTIVGAGGVTISSNAATSAQPKCRNQFASATCIKVASDTWYVIGDIA
jgi:hypothetical protein